MKIDFSIDYMKVLESDEDTTLVELDLLHTGKNRNQYTIGREAVERAIPTIYNKPIISVGVDTKSDFKVIYENNIRIVGGKLFGEPREIIIPPNLSKINNLIKK